MEQIRVLREMWAATIQDGDFKVEFYPAHPVVGPDTVLDDKNRENLMSEMSKRDIEQLEQWSV